MYTKPAAEDAVYFEIHTLAGTSNFNVAKTKQLEINKWFKPGSN